MQVSAPDSVSAQAMPKPLPSVQPWGEQLCQRPAVGKGAVTAQIGQQSGDGVVAAFRRGCVGCNALVGEFVSLAGNLTALFCCAAERRRKAHSGICRNGVWRSAGGEPGDGVGGRFGEL